MNAQEPSATPSQRISLELRSISRFFDDVRAVDDISLRIRAGEFVTLLGASGSGKTTTLMIIAGFQNPNSGNVLIDGEDVTGVPPYRRNLGLVYQHYALFPNMTVAKNVAFPLEMRRRPKEEIGKRVAAVLDLVNLGGYEDRMPQQLSGGQQQRVALARALVFEPPVLLMDEPLGALDKKLREQMQEEIMRIHHKLGTTTVYVTHDQEEALTMSDRIVVLSEGRIAQSGKPEEIYERPATRFVADFMGATNFISGTVKEEGPPAVVCTEHGAILNIDGAGLARGDAVTVAVRPERVRIATGQNSLPWSWGGRIEQTVYVGGIRRYHVLLDGGDRLIVSQPNLGDSPISHGAKVRVTWRPDDGLVLRE